MIEEAVARLGGLDVLVWNTGGPRPGPEVGIDGPAAEEAFRSLLLPLVRVVGAALPHLRASRNSRIVAITTTTVKEPTSQVAVSSPVRPGLAGCLKTPAGELAPDGNHGQLWRRGGSSPRTSTTSTRRGSPTPTSQTSRWAGSAARRSSPPPASSPRSDAATVTGTTIAVDGGLSRSIV